MVSDDFRAPRLFLESPLSAGAVVALSVDQFNYLRHVLRLRDGQAVLVFNGRDGEWRAELRLAGRRQASVTILAQRRAQSGGADLRLLFAPLKHARLDYLVQKAVEMGVSHLVPVLTRHTQAQRVNLQRMRANAIEAAEQCGILAIPEIAAPVELACLIRDWPAERLLLFCDEARSGGQPLATLAAARSQFAASPRPIGVLIGPEGGFHAEERAALGQLPNLVALSLGPRILRADTAAVAALALVQAVLGDWH